MLKFMYITNDPNVAKIAENSGVDRIFIDMEYIGKAERQGGMDTVQNHHTVNDVVNVRKAISKADLLVRVNPVYDGLEEEINSVIDAGADIIMLPMWKSAKDVFTFLSFVNGRAKTILLLENESAMNSVDEVIKNGGFDEMYIGLNDLHLSLKRKFLFELLADGTVDSIVPKLKVAGIPFGIGGLGRLQNGTLPADYILGDYVRLGASTAILSRAFCNTNFITDYDEINAVFSKGIKDLREYEAYLSKCNEKFFAENHIKLQQKVSEIVRD